MAKTINSLMMYLRNNHNIIINGSKHKQKLRNYGYYHGYKGYRFIKTSSNKINFSNFDELCSIVEFDNNMKALFYPQIMFIETALKNYVLELILEETQSENFNIIFSKALVDYKSYPKNSDNYRKAVLKRLNLQSLIYSTLAKNYKNDKDVIVHFYHQKENIPIWAIFEVISLGDFGTLVSCLEKTTRQQITKNLNMNYSCDSNGKLIQSIIFVLKELRNSFSHNDIIFDTRFKKINIANGLINCLKLDTGVTNIDFNSLADYLILTIYCLKSFGYTKTELKKIISDFEKTTEKLRQDIPSQIYNQIMATDTRNKLNLLKSFI